MSLINIKKTANWLIVVFFISFLIRNESEIISKYLSVSDAIFYWAYEIEVFSFLILLIFLHGIFVFEASFVGIKYAFKQNLILVFAIPLSFVPLVMSYFLCQHIEVYSKTMDVALLEKALLAHKVNMEDLERSIEMRNEYTTAIAKTIYWENQESWAIINKDGSEGIFSPTEEDISFVQKKTAKIQRLKSNRERHIGLFVLNMVSIIIGIIIGFLTARRMKKAGNI